MSDVQPRQFGSAIQWNFGPVDASPESWERQFEVTEDPSGALAEEQRSWSNQACEAAHETSQGIRNHQAMADAIGYTFPWCEPSDEHLRPSHGVDSLLPFNGPEADPPRMTSGSLPDLPSTSATTHNANASIAQHLFDYNTEETINRLADAYTLPDNLLSGAETSMTPSASRPVPFISGNVGDLPLTLDGPSGVSTGPAMWPADAGAQNTQCFLQWGAGADQYAPLGLMGYNPNIVMPSTSLEGYGPDPSQGFIPPTHHQSSGATHQAHHTGYEVVPAWIPGSVNISTEVRNNSNNNENINGEGTPLPHTPLDALTLQSEHVDDSQSSVSAQQENTNEVLPIIPRPSKETASLPCGFCTQKFSDVNSRNKHEKLHTRTKGNQPSCPGCKKKLARLDAVVRHVRRQYEKDRTSKCVVVALRRGWRHDVRGTGKRLLPGQGLVCEE